MLAFKVPRSATNVYLSDVRLTPDAGSSIGGTVDNFAVNRRFGKWKMALVRKIRDSKQPEERS